MLRAGGEAKRKELIAQFEELSIAEQSRWTQEEEKIAKYGDYRQAENLTEQKVARQLKKQ